MLKYTVYQRVTGRMGGDKDGPGGAGNTVNPGPNHCEGVADAR